MPPREWLGQSVSWMRRAFPDHAQYSGAAIVRKTRLAYVTGSVDDELLRRNEYLVAESRTLRTQIPGRVTLTDGERDSSSTIGI